MTNSFGQKNNVVPLYESIEVKVFFCIYMNLHSLFNVRFVHSMCMCVREPTGTHIAVRAPTPPHTHNNAHHPPPPRLHHGREGKKECLVLIITQEALQHTGHKYRHKYVSWEWRIDIQSPKCMVVYTVFKRHSLGHTQTSLLNAQLRERALLRCLSQWNSPNGSEDNSG